MAFLLGVLTLYQLSVLPTVWLGVLILPALIGQWTVSRSVLVTSFVLGFLIALLQAHWQLGQRLPIAFEGKQVVVSGSISSIPEQQGRRIRFLFQTESIEFEGHSQPLNARLRLSWFESDQAPAAGERWLLTTRLKQPRGFSNPGGFDYESWLYRNGIDGTGYVRNKGANVRLERASGASLNHLRQGLLVSLQSRFSETDAVRALVPALTLGVRDFISDERWEIFRATGTGHLMAISGLHIGIVAGLFYWMGFHLWRQCVLCTRRFAAMRAAALMAMVGALGYAALAGFSVPTQRASLMLAVFMLAVMAGRKIAPLRLLAVALVAVLMLDTSAVLAPGFWLSFGAVLVIILAFGRDETTSRWRQLVYLQVLLSLVFVPLTGWFFGEASLVSPVANLVAVPVMTLVVVPLSLLFSMLAASTNWELQSMTWLLELILGSLDLWLAWLASWPLASVPLPDFSLPVLVACLGIVGGALYLRRKRSLLLLLLVFPVLMMAGGRQVAPGALRITFPDVGQGLSVVLETHQHTLVYDLGPRFGSGFNAAQAVVLPYLESRGITHVDRLVISHDDIDHRGALEDFASEINVESILAGNGVRGVSGIEQCEAGQSWQWDGVLFEILHPAFNSTGDDNEQSCVLKVSTKHGFSLLLTGDVTAAVEAGLASSESLGVNVLQVPHHGSGTSSSQALLQATEPEVAVATLGYGNRWGFPKPDVVARYVERGTEFLRTDRTGAVIFEVSESSDEYRVTLWRQEHARFWMAARITD